MHRIAFTTVAALTGAASAQLAFVITTHDDPDGLVLPGQTIRVTTTVSWLAAGVQFAGIEGDQVTSPNLGVASDPTSAYTPGALVSLGHISGASIIGIDIAQTPAFFTGGVMLPPSGNNTGFELIGFDWTAPAGGFAGPVEFIFEPDPSAPDVRFYWPPGGPWFPQPGYTEWIGARVVVVPGPGGAALGLAALAAAKRRMRR